MLRFLLFLGCFCTPTALVWFDAEIRSCSADQVRISVPSEKYWLLVAERGAFSYYVPAMRTCTAYSGGSSHGMSWYCGWQRADGQWVVCREGKLVVVQPVKVVRRVPAGDPAPVRRCGCRAHHAPALPCP